MAQDDFRFRQVHLDFHTSPAIPCVGSAFNKKEWQAALQAGHVDSITVFSKCHHGYSFHPSRVNEMHPGLTFDLLGAQLEACREIGVRAPVYISAGLDEKDALAHPEWLQRNRDDRNECGDFFTARFHYLCLHTAYLDKLLAEIDEVMEVYKPCGIFLDILFERRCYCATCRADMQAQGLDYMKDEDVDAFSRQVFRHYLDAVEETVRRHSATATIFHNSGHIHRGRRDLLNRDTHLELESLPTGGWGYDHFPMSAGYARTLGMDFLGMTGKFHQSWGEFGGFKHPNALRYEAALSIAMGAGCSIGDQMHPEGRLNMSTFSLIGKAYAEVEAKEPWCKGAVNLADIAVLGTEATDNDHCDDNDRADMGANRILLETHRLYNFIDCEEDFSKYKLLILPDAVCIGEALHQKLEAYLAAGGKLLLSGRSGLSADDRFLFDTGAQFLGENEYRPTYCLPQFPTVNGQTEYLMRARNYRIRATDGEVLCLAQNPYFNRTPHHYCSHQHAPNDRSESFPAAVLKGNVAYIGWEIFKGYALYGDLHQKELAAYVIERLLGGDASVRAGLPDRGVVALTQQGARKIVHLLYAHTTLRGENTEVIEDIVPLFNIPVSVQADGVQSVRIVPEGRELPFTCADGRVCFTVPAVHMHCMVELACT